MLLIKGQKRGEQPLSSSPGGVVMQARGDGSHRVRAWAMLSAQNTNKKSFKNLTIIQKSKGRQMLSEVTA